MAGCASCPAGYSCDSFSGSTTVCSSGEYSLAGEMNCTECPKGYMCPFTMIDKILCPSGTHTGGLTMQTSCQNCPAGSYCHNSMYVTKLLTLHIYIQ